MVKVKSVEEVATKFVDVTPARAPYYEAEVKASGPDWLSGGKAGQSAYEAAMQDTETLARRAKNMDDQAAAKFVDKAGGVGPARFRDGVGKAKNYFIQGWTGAHDVIAAWVKPKKAPRGDPANYDIVKSIGDALHKKRVGS